jgi:pimeloyl-ACP methyl ester carboxylesterase
MSDQARGDDFAIPEELRPFARSVEVGGVQVHCYDAGSAAGAAALLLVHGLGDEADTWRHVLGPLAARRRVVALDLPGFGRSGHPRRASTTAFFARVAGDLLGALGIERATLVGHSMGAAVAQRLALARPELVERLVLVAGCLPVHAGLPPGPLWAFLTPGLGEAGYTSLRRAADGGYSTLRPYYADLDSLPEADRAFLAARVRARVWSDGQRRAFLSALRWMAIDRALRAGSFHDQAAHQRTPTLLVWGERDAIVPQAAAYAMAALLPDARVEVLPGAGHHPAQEQPARLVELIEGFLTA